FRHVPARSAGAPAHPAVRGFHRGPVSADTCAHPTIPELLALLALGHRPKQTGPRMTPRPLRRYPAVATPSQGATFHARHLSKVRRHNRHNGNRSPAHKLSLAHERLPVD